MSHDDVIRPLGFKVRQGQRRADILCGAAGAEVFQVEARQIGFHLKEAVVTEGAEGCAWRMLSDEGTFMKGTDLAPFPLGFFNAGLQSDLAARMMQIASRQGIDLSALSLRLITAYALTGSFAKGTGQGFCDRIEVHVEARSTASNDAIGGLVRAAVRQSPAFDLLTRPLANTFALYVNGRRRNPTTLPASAAADAVDPYLRYTAAPRPLTAADDLDGLIVKTADTTSSADAPQQPSAPTATLGRVSWRIVGDGTADLAARHYRCKVALDRPGSTHFSYTTDESDAQRGPSGLALVSAAIAFCYMTQISRYVDAQGLAISGVRMVQFSPYAIGADAAGRASPCDTHLFMNGEADTAMFEQLQRVAANTCYLHQTMDQATPLDISLTHNGGSVQV